MIKKSTRVRKGDPTDVFWFCWLLPQWEKINSDYFGMNFREVGSQGTVPLKAGYFCDSPIVFFIFLIFPAVAASLG